jgi:hypothetical protein
VPTATGPQVVAPQGTLLQRYANARILLFANQVPGVLDSPPIGRVLLEAFLQRRRRISSQATSPTLDTGDFTYEGYLTRGALLPLLPTSPWDWLDAAIPWSTTGLRPFLSDGSTLLSPCSGAIWLGELAHLQRPGVLPPLNRAQLAGFSVLEFGGPYGCGGIGSRTQPLLGERIVGSLKPHRVVVIAPGDSLVVLAQRHLTSVAVLQGLNPTITARPADPLPLGSWLFIPKRRAAANATVNVSANANASASTTSLPAGM